MLEGPPNLVILRCPREGAGVEGRNDGDGASFEGHLRWPPQDDEAGLASAIVRSK
jgi:hypothetical protein